MFFEVFNKLMTVQCSYTYLRFSIASTHVPVFASGSRAYRTRQVRVAFVGMCSYESQEIHYRPP